MAPPNPLFGRRKFKDKIREFASKCNWEVDKATDSMVKMSFQTESGDEYQLYAALFDDVIEFSVPSSFLAFEDDDNIPDFLSTILMKRNAGRKHGMWAIEKIGDHSVFSCMQNVPERIVEADYFRTLVGSMVEEVGDVKGLLMQAMDKMRE